MHKRIILLIVILSFSCSAFAAQEKTLSRAEVIEKLSAADFVKKKIGNLLNWKVGYDITKINRTNLAPTITDMTIRPVKVPPDNRTVIALRVRVSDPGGLTNIRGVRADLSTIGKRPNMMLVDDGLWGDENSSDGIFTVQTSVSEDINKGTKNIPVAVSNKKGWVAIGKTSINVEKNPKVISTSSSPKEVKANGSEKTKLEVKLENPGGVEDIKSVIIDLSQIGYESNASMYDDGTRGDTKANDGIFTYITTVKQGIRSGAKKISIKAQNFIGGKSFGEIVLVVK